MSQPLDKEPFYDGSMNEPIEEVIRIRVAEFKDNIVDTTTYIADREVAVDDGTSATSIAA
ncbi:hypothetical protein [Agromyces sp. SYSU T0242]|uniref:hypothetical protein n=1 Tax=Agromyces litoreus TaxID=3158561 RepID=UPI00339195E4